ncbi:MAG: hypothetical protein M1820_004266 [Bogoriella megaspora]|nr:MAG: hypothetical protein M1820_004266 [Bogoriella megaspora]
MLSVASVAALTASIPLTPQEALSGVSGSISLASWIFLLVPQLIENYQQGSASGISLLFLFVWFLGDITNLLGAVWAGLVPTVIAIAVYFCFADVILILQCIYYNAINAQREKKEAERIKHLANGNGFANGDALASPLREDAPLLARQRSDSSVALPGSRRRSSLGSRRRRSTLSRRDSLERVLEETSGKRVWFKNSVSIFLVCAAGAAGWAIAWRAGIWRPAPPDDEIDPAGAAPIGAEVLGYASAVLYLGARIPQIIKNQREKSCEGLSLLFFMLSLMGNATYGAGILFHSVEKDYVLNNLPWLIGSLGTMVEDVIIFIQFHTFGNNADSEAIE